MKQRRKTRFVRQGIRKRMACAVMLAREENNGYSAEMAARAYSMASRTVRRYVKISREPLDVENADEPREYFKYTHVSNMMHRIDGFRLLRIRGKPAKRKKKKKKKKKPIKTITERISDASEKELWDTYFAGAANEWDWGSVWNLHDPAGAKGEMFGAGHGELGDTSGRWPASQLVWFRRYAREHPRCLPRRDLRPDAVRRLGRPWPWRREPAR